MKEDYHYRDYVIVPYNHWKYDTNWIVEIKDPVIGLVHITRAVALDPERAAEIAVEEFIEAQKKA